MPFSLMTASCLGLRPPAVSVTTDGRFPPVNTVSAAGHHSTFWEYWDTMIALLLLELAEKDCFMHANVFFKFFLAMWLAQNS